MASDMGIEKPGKGKRITGCRSSRLTLPATAAAIAAGLVLVLYAALGFFPFGRSSVLLTDLYSQYAPLLYRFYDCLTGRAGLFAELRMAGGVNLYVDTIRSFLDPFNYILLFFGRERLYLALNILVLLYMAAAAFTACFALRRFFPGAGGLCVPLAVCYGVSGYAVYNYQILYWLLFPVLFPLLLMALRDLLRGEKPGRSGLIYAQLLAWMTAVSLQLGWEVCLAVFFGSACYLHSCFPREGQTERQAAGARRLFVYTAAGLLLASPVLVPAVLQLFSSARAGYTAGYSGVMQQHGLNDLFERLFLTLHPGATGAFLALLAGRRAKKTGKKDPTGQKTFLARINALLWLTVLLQPANLLWHLGSYRCFPVRYGYIVLFAGLCLTAREAELQLQQNRSFEENADARQVRDTSAPDSRFGIANDEANGSRKPGVLIPESAEDGERRRHTRRSLRLGKLLCGALGILTAGALLWRWQAGIAQAFSTLAVSQSCPKQTAQTALILSLLCLGTALLFSAENGAAGSREKSASGEKTSFRERSASGRIPDSDGRLETAGQAWGAYAAMCLSSLCLAFCVFLPGSLSIRAMNDEAYATMTKYAAEHGLPSGGRQTGTDLFQYRSDEENLSTVVAGANEGEGAEEALKASMLTGAEDLPRDAALVTGTSSLTSYFPTLSAAAQTALSSLGYQTYWTATDGEGGTEDTDWLLETPLLLSGSPEDYAFQGGSTEEHQKAVQAIRRDVTAAGEISGGMKQTENAQQTAEFPQANGASRAAEDTYYEEKALRGEAGSGRTLTADEIAAVPRSSEFLVTLSGVERSSTVFLPLVLQPGWHAAINGQAVQISPVFGGFLGIPVSAGKSEIRIWFRPAGITAGLLCGAAGVLLLVLLYFGRSDTGVKATKRRCGQNDFGTGGAWRQIYRLLFMAGLVLIYLIPAAGLLFFMGRKAFRTTAVPQASWQVFETEEVPEGLRVRTVGENLCLKAGVRVRADSTESRKFPASLARNGVADDPADRWSSANTTENHDHWLEVILPERTQVGAVRIVWERTNMTAGAVEVSENGRDWRTAAELSTPESLVQDVVLEAPAEAKYVRLHVTDVRQEESDLSLYYQNVSVLEFEVFSGIRDDFVIRTPVVRETKEGGQQAGTGQQERDDTEIISSEKEAAAQERFGRRVLVTPDVPDGFTLTFAGARPEAYIDEDGNCTQTLSDVTVPVGYTLSADGVTVSLPAMKVTIPASEGWKDKAVSENQGNPETGRAPDTAEWLPTGGTLQLTKDSRVLIAADDSTDREDVKKEAALLAEELGTSLHAGGSLAVGTCEASEKGREGAESAQHKVGEGAESTQREVGEGAESAQCEGGEEAESAQREDGAVNIILRLSGSGENSDIPVPGAEGFVMDLGADGPDIVLTASTVQGLRWACVELENLGSGPITRGYARDDPAYAVRGFGIDVARRSFSLDFLKDIVKRMSRARMNTLEVHLNDNAILAQSSYDGTVEGARQLPAAFRLESDLRGKDGKSITSEDGSYAKEEFAELIRFGAVYGVDVVPEIDTPAHCLALTRAFPEYGRSDTPEAADELDLSRDGARKLGESVWKEYLGENGCFADAAAVSMGMDEYFGNARDFVQYFTELAGTIQAEDPDKIIRAWGSFTREGADYSSVPRSVQLKIWDLTWADAEEMTEAGFDIINTQGSHLYIIPGAGYDRLDLSYLAKDWEPNVFTTERGAEEIPVYSSHMLGAMYYMWNEDMSGNKGAELLDDAALFDRFEEPLDILSGKLWKWTDE